VLIAQSLTVATPSSGNEIRGGERLEKGENGRGNRENENAVVIDGKTNR